MDTENTSLFTHLSATEEETLAGGLGFFKSVGRWFKKNWAAVGVGVAGACIFLFGGKKYFAHTDEYGNRVYTPME